MQRTLYSKENHDKSFALMWDFWHWYRYKVKGIHPISTEAYSRIEEKMMTRTVTEI